MLLSASRHPPPPPLPPPDSRAGPARPKARHCCTPAERPSVHSLPTDARGQIAQPQPRGRPHQKPAPSPPPPLPRPKQAQPEAGRSPTLARLLSAHSPTSNACGQIAQQQRGGKQGLRPHCSPLPHSLATPAPPKARHCSALPKRLSPHSLPSNASGHMPQLQTCDHRRSAMTTLPPPRNRHVHACRTAAWSGPCAYSFMLSCFRQVILQAQHAATRTSRKAARQQTGTAMVRCHQLRYPSMPLGRFSSAATQHFPAAQQHECTLLCFSQTATLPICATAAAVTTQTADTQQAGSPALTATAASSKSAVTLVTYRNTASIAQVG